MVKKVRWGILSTANIGMEKVTPAIMRSAHSEVVAIASRDQSKAQAAADKLGIARAHGSYEALLADPVVDDEAAAEATLDELLSVHAPYLPQFGQ